MGVGGNERRGVTNLSIPALDDLHRMLGRARFAAVEHVEAVQRFQTLSTGASTSWALVRTGADGTAGNLVGFQFAVTTETQHARSHHFRQAA